jgi:hypothetical protein
MRKNLASGSIPGSGPAAIRPVRLAHILLLAAFVLLASSCKSIPPLDTKPLDAAGMDYPAIKQLNALKITAPEVTEIAKARGAGFSDDGCVELVRIYQGRGKAFDAGDTVAGLIQVGMREDTILELARLDQLGLGAGELEVLRLAGLSDPVELEIARHRAAGKPTLSGVSLANMKNAGMREATLLELVRRGVPDSDAAEILALRRHGVKEVEILRHFPGS